MIKQKKGKHKMKNLTQDEKREIATMYADKSIRVQEIADTYGIERRYVALIGAEYGVAPRKRTEALSDEVVAEIIKAYVDEKRSVDSIANEFKCAASTITKIMKRNGIATRRPGKKTTKLVCNHCRREIDLKDISFCPYCGKDIRTEEQLLIEDLQNSLGIIATSQVPSNSKDKIRNSLLEAIKWIKAHS